MVGNVQTAVIKQGPLLRTAAVWFSAYSAVARKVTQVRL